MQKESHRLLKEGWPTSHGVTHWRFARAYYDRLPLVLFVNCIRQIYVSYMFDTTRNWCSTSIYIVLKDDREMLNLFFTSCINVTSGGMQGSNGTSQRTTQRNQSGSFFTIHFFFIWTIDITINRNLPKEFFHQECRKVLLRCRKESGGRVQWHLLLITFRSQEKEHFLGTKENVFTPTTNGVLPKEIAHTLRPSVRTTLTWPLLEPWYEFWHNFLILHCSSLLTDERRLREDFLNSPFNVIPM